MRRISTIAVAVLALCGVSATLAFAHAPVKSRLPAPKSTTSKTVTKLYIG